MALMDGKKVAAQVRVRMKEQVDKRLAAGKKKPHLAAILVGNDKASDIYVQHKMNDCQEVGMGSSVHRFNASTKEEEVIACLHRLNRSNEVDGIIVQLPLPAHISKQRLINTINPNKDVDGLHYENFGRLCGREPRFLPATLYGILTLLRHYNIETKGMHVVVVGRSYVVGLPISIVLALRGSPGNATVTLTHIHTHNLSFFTRSADMIITAVGKPNLLTADMVKEGSIVVDVGITRVADDTKSTKYVLKGDVDFPSVAAKTSYITPVPNGVGPMTRAALLMNTLQAAEGVINGNPLFK